MQIVKWATADTHDRDTDLYILHSAGATRMEHSQATGDGLLSNGYLGVDRIALEGGRGFVPHTHPGDHILIVIGGLGTITLGGEVHPTRAGEAYMVPGEVAHAVGARTDHVILAVGAPHKAVDDPTRMVPVEYRAVVSSLAGTMTCLACEEETSQAVTAALPRLLHEVGCDHCPCFYCVSTGDPAEDADLRAGLERLRHEAAFGVRI